MNAISALSELVAEFCFVLFPCLFVCVMQTIHRETHVTLWHPLNRKDAVGRVSFVTQMVSRER